MVSCQRSAGVVLAATLALIEVGATASASTWEKVVAEGDASPEERPYGSPLLAPWIADDGAVSFADVPYSPLPNPPFYTLWRASAASGVQPLATIEARSGDGSWRARPAWSRSSPTAWWRRCRSPGPCAADRPAPSSSR